MQITMCAVKALRNTLKKEQAQATHMLEDECARIFICWSVKLATPIDQILAS